MKIKYINLKPGCFWEIKVPKEFKERPPSPEKLIRKTLDFCRDSEAGTILVDGDMNLLDGYCSYLIVKQTDIKFAKIKQAKAVK